MCGIAGQFNFSGRPVVAASIREMTESMRYRGPDDDGIYVDRYVGLGHRRLSIIDLSKDGHQPMSSENGDQVLVYNGEIYNYLELREQLSREFNFKTRTDTEVILKAYQKWGVDCLHHFNGMFALALWDRSTQRLWLARDRFGVKPLYYYQDGQRLLFASEIVPILQALGESPEVEESSVYDFLVYNRTDHTEKTFFKGIHRLPHGHTLMIDKGGVRSYRWYDLSKRIGKPFFTSRELLETLESAVRLRMRSDVPVGACLSGGLDSSSIVALALKEPAYRDLHTFSAVYESGDRADESRFLQEFDHWVRNPHYARPTAESLVEDLEDYTRALQEPVPGLSGYAEFKVYELASRYVTVILNGQGADECLVGYLYLLGFLYKEQLRSGEWLGLLRNAVGDWRLHRSLEGLQALVYFSLPSNLQEAVAIDRHPWIDRGFLARHRGQSEFLQPLYGAPTLQTALINHFEYKFEHHLVWGDRSSMWFSLEARFPFLDYRFVEGAISLSSRDQVRSGETKSALREAMTGLLPEKIRKRKDKTGYETPEDRWFRTPVLQSLMKDLLLSRQSRERGVLDFEEVESMLWRHASGRDNFGPQLGKLLSLEMWFRNLVERRHDVAHSRNVGKESFRPARPQRDFELS